jgi:hypothetical protein
MRAMTIDSRMGRSWLILSLATGMAAVGCGHADRCDDVGTTERRAISVIHPAPNDDIAALRIDLAQLVGEERVRAATRPTTGPAARWRWLSAGISLESGGTAPGPLADDERFAAVGKTFRVASLNDRSTVLTFPTGERLSVDDGIAAQMAAANIDALRQPAASAENPGRELVSLLGEWIADTQAVAHGLGRLPSALAEALEGRRAAGGDAGPIERVIRELLDSETTGFRAAWRDHPPDRVRLRFDEPTRQALSGLVRPAGGK